MGPLQDPILRPYDPEALEAALKNKKDDFIGKQALYSRQSSPQRVLVGLHVDATDCVANDPVFVGRQQVGVVTSACRSPILRKTIAMCRMDVSCSGIGTPVEVGKLDGRMKRLPATVVKMPFYDPEKLKPRGKA